MYISQVSELLDQAVKTRKNKGKYFNVLLEGDAGLGKSMAVQQWAKKNKYQLIDLRAALMERPDLLGFPFVDKDSEDIPRTKYAIPELLPTKGKGVLFLDEINRAPNAIQNIFMKLLTRDKFENGYEFPEGWLIVGAINPDSEAYNVNSMDTALKARFVPFEIEYNQKAFIDYMKACNFNNELIRYVESLFVYRKPQELGDSDQYISPRNIEQMNEFMQTGISYKSDLFRKVSQSIFGQLASEFLSFLDSDRPILFLDFIKDESLALKELKKSNKTSKDFRGDKISVTVNEIIDNFTHAHVTDEFIVKVISVLPKGNASQLLQKYFVFKGFSKDIPKVKKFIEEYKLSKIFPKISDIFIMD